jgi:hypothetical protein
MSHIDEGLLHAYLDGETAGAERSGLEQHLEGCAECRDRLEQARTLRDRSAAILSGSGPASVAPPPFEQIVARSRAVEARRRVFRLNRLTALGWAATIVLAVGVGWIARGTLGFGERPVSESGFTIADSAAPQLAEQVAQPEAEAPERALERAPTREGRVESGRAQRRDEPAPTVLKSEVSPAEEKPADVRAEPEEARAKMAEADVEQQPAAGVATPAAPAAAPARGRGAIAQADSMEQAQRERKAARGAAAEDAFAAGEVDLDAILGGAGEGTAWRVADEATAGERLGGAVMRLPGADVVAYLVPAEPDRAAMQVVQRLESGDIVVLTQEPAAAISAAEEEMGARDELMAMNEPASQVEAASVTLRRGDYVLTLRGNLPPDSLRALLEQLP